MLVYVRCSRCVKRSSGIPVVDGPQPAAARGLKVSRAHLLFLQAQPIAYLFCPARNGALIYDKQEYDLRHATCSPGSILEVLALQSLFKGRTHRMTTATAAHSDSAIREWHPRSREQWHKSGYYRPSTGNWRPAH